ncbi:translation initiation factor 2 subunit beta [Catovirus CTV1]|uniref:Translation initiation factor 2 subunit beta n=1 Tax=Catovirus CTV1 TaxID=1977631 RepID=A0A1V0SBR8_9VIRU|nr:translation initiation factor 2 subunit beta [Catovirus CTV1]
MTSTYELNDLLERVYGNLNALNNKTKINLPKLLVTAENKKTFFSNYRKVCQELNRNDADLVRFVQKELATNVSINGNDELVIEGMYREKQIEKVLVNYIEQYVKCKMCKSLSTTVIKENRKNILSCNKCKATSTLQSD